MFGRRNKNTFHLEECALTGLSVRDETAKFIVDTSDVAYWVTYKELSCCIVLCGTLYEMLTDRSCTDNSDELYLRYYEHDIIEMNNILPVFFGELGKNDFRQLFDRKKTTIHWDCDVLKAKNPEEHISIKPFTNIFTKNSRYQYPKTDFDKLRLILNEFKKHKLGETIEMYGLEYFGKFYMRDNEELQSYINYLEKKEWIKRHCEIHVELTELPEFIEKYLINNMENNNNAINNYGNMTINSGDGNTSHQTQNIGNTFSQENKNDIKEIIQFLKENIEHLNLSNDDATDIQDDIQVLESQIIRENPKKDRIKNTLQSIVTSITANVLSPNTNLTDIINKAKALIDNIGY